MNHTNFRWTVYQILQEVEFRRFDKTWLSPIGLAARKLYQAAHNGEKPQQLISPPRAPAYVYEGEEDHKLVLTAAIQFFAKKNNIDALQDLYHYVSQLEIWDDLPEIVNEITDRDIEADEQYWEEFERQEELKREQKLLHQKAFDQILANANKQLHKPDDKLDKWLSANREFNFHTMLSASTN